MKEFNRVYHNLIAPDEAVKHTRHYNYFYISERETVRQIWNAYNRMTPNRNDMYNFSANFYVTLFNAGRLQGIREERLRRKPVQRF